MEWAEVVDNPLLQDLPFKIGEMGHGEMGQVLLCYVKEL